MSGYSDYYHLTGTRANDPSRRSSVKRELAAIAGWDAQKAKTRWTCRKYAFMSERGTPLSSCRDDSGRCKSPT
jgi:hypothetical protein